MTFRTFDIDAGVVNGATDGAIAGSDSPARSVRLRRRAAVMNHRSSGGRISGFGI